MSDLPERSGCPLKRPGCTIKPHPSLWRLRAGHCEDCRGRRHHQSGLCPARAPVAHSRMLLVLVHWLLLHACTRSPIIYVHAVEAPSQQCLSQERTTYLRQLRPREVRRLMSLLCNFREQGLLKDFNDRLLVLPILQAKQWSAERCNAAFIRLALLSNKDKYACDVLLGTHESVFLCPCHWLKILCTSTCTGEITLQGFWRSRLQNLQGLCGRFNLPPRIDYVSIGNASHQNNPGCAIFPDVEILHSGPYLGVICVLHYCKQPPARLLNVTHQDQHKVLVYPSCCKQTERNIWEHEMNKPHHILYPNLQLDASWEKTLHILV